MIKIKACKPFRSEDIENYYVTAIVYNAGRKAEVLYEFDVWAPGHYKKKNSQIYMWKLGTSYQLTNFPRESM